MTAEHACPLCGLGLESRDAVYRHLQVGHRKSTLSEAVLESTGDPDAVPRPIE